VRETFFRPRLAVLEVIDRVPGGLGDIPRCTKIEHAGRISPAATATPPA
jgi:hypothetical protein